MRHGTVTDKPHAAGRGVGRAGRGDPVAGAVRQPERAGSARLREFPFVDARGRPQLSGCLKALAALAEREPGIALPPHPSRIGGLRVGPVTARGDRALWNTLMAREHPHGMAVFAGRQLRHLVGSDHSWLGAARFPAAALRVAARDRWIAWDDGTRRAHPARVVRTGRFLVQPSVRCPHLASHVPGRILRRLPGDFAERHGFRPWLAGSFADGGYDGIRLRAAGFLCVGATAGRGRQDRDHRRERTVRTVFMRGLERSWRGRPGVPRVDHAPSPGPGEGLDAAVRAENGFGGAPLGDRRLPARLVRSAGLLAGCPGQRINASSDSGDSDVASFHRMTGSPDGSEVTAPNILATHRGRTVQRIRGQRTVLAIQDGTDLNLPRRAGRDGLEPIGRNRATSSTPGLHMHATLAVTDTGLPPGLPRLGFDPAKASPKDGRTGRRRGRRRSGAAGRSAGWRGSTTSPTPSARSAEGRG